MADVASLKSQAIRHRRVAAFGKQQHALQMGGSVRAISGSVIECLRESAVRPFGEWTALATAGPQCANVSLRHAFKAAESKSRKACHSVHAALCINVHC